MDSSRKALLCSVDGLEETAEEAAVQRGLKSGGARTVCRVEKNSGQQDKTKAKTVPQGLLGITGGTVTRCLPTRAMGQIPSADWATWGHMNAVTLGLLVCIEDELTGGHILVDTGVSYSTFPHSSLSLPSAPPLPGPSAVATGSPAAENSGLDCCSMTAAFRGHYCWLIAVCHHWGWLLLSWPISE